MKITAYSLKSEVFTIYTNYVSSTICNEDLIIAPKKFRRPTTMEQPSNNCISANYHWKVLCFIFPVSFFFSSFFFLFPNFFSFVHIFTSSVSQQENTSFSDLWVSNRSTFWQMPKRFQTAASDPLRWHKAKMATNFFCLVNY